MAACAACGVEPSRDGARFCDACGAALNRSDDHAEFKQVTVLFADVVGSMDIAAAVGAERLREIMAELVRRGTGVVQRYGGTMDKFTGDGLMAVFGAPIALEDHAIRAGLAALGIQTEAAELARDVQRRDGITLRLRVGLNSGQVIAGEIGSGAASYTTIGEQVGLAQRMESVAEPGAVMVSEATAQLLTRSAVLGERELVRIKGSDTPTPAHRLLAIEARHGVAGSDPNLIGRRWEMGAVEGLLDRCVGGRGGVLGVVGPPGIGKSRLAREAAVAAADRGMDVVWTHCESHTSDISFNVVTRLLRAATRIGDLDASSARQQIRAQFADSDDQDHLLLEDLLGIRDPAVPPPNVAADARRRRLTAMINAATVASERPALYVIEDAHWMDETSESMLADFFAVIPQTPTMVLLTYRPEYAGALTRASGMATIALAPLDDSETAMLVAELAGRDPSLAGLSATIISRVRGNPFFAEEMVRDLAERGVLSGERGGYACRSDVTDVAVPATLQATIGARIDRLGREAKRALSAAAVIGSRFNTDLLLGLGVEPAVDELVRAELIDQVRFAPLAEYAFRHPLIRTVAYEAQLKSDRAETHRRLAAAIQVQSPAALDEKSALIAEHLEAAGDLREAYDWHMRAGGWSVSRDVTAARVSWERARGIADRLQDDEPDRTAMRIAPRAMLCASIWRGVPDTVSVHFEELRELCESSGDTASLAIGLYGLAAEHMFYGRVPEASRVASELMAILDSSDYPDSIIGVAFLAIGVKAETGEAHDVLRLAQRVIDWADGDPTKGNVIAGSPLAIAVVWRATARWSLGLAGWPEDLREAVTMARAADPATHAMVIGFKHAANAQGVLKTDDDSVSELEDALRVAEGLSDDTALGSLRFGAGSAFIHHRDAGVRGRGLELLEQFHEMCLRGRFFASERAAVEMCIARESARLGDSDTALPILRRSFDDLVRNGQLVNVIIATRFLVEALLSRAAAGDQAEADAAVHRLENMPTDDDFVVLTIMVLRLRALLARARGSDDEYRDLVVRYREMAKSLGFEGHVAWSEAM